MLSVYLAVVAVFHKEKIHGQEFVWPREVVFLMLFAWNLTI